MAYWRYWAKVVGRREVAASAAIERMDFIVGSVVLGGLFGVYTSD